MKSFIEKYKPKLEEIPQQKLIKKIRENVISSIPTILVGPTGSCKTSIAYKIAEELDYEIIEINSSDLRNKEEIKRVIGGSLNQQSLFQKNKLILIDEIDGMAGREDWGGVGALKELLSNPKQSIILTANDKDNKNLKDLKKGCKLINLDKIDLFEIVMIIKNICEQENIKYTEQQLKAIAIASNGDLRAAINDLQSNSPDKELDLIDLQKREIEGGIIEALDKILRKLDKNSVFALNYINCDLNESALWIEENMPFVYFGKELEDGFGYMSKADIFKSRIIKQQYWRFLVYQNLFLSLGINSVKTTEKSVVVKYKRSSRILKIWLNNQRVMNKKNISKNTYFSQRGF